MKIKVSAVRKRGRIRPAGSRRVFPGMHRLKVVQGPRRRRRAKSGLSRRRGARGRYRLRRVGRVFPVSSQAYNQGFSQAYDEGFKAGFAKGYEDGLAAPPPPIS